MEAEPNLVKSLFLEACELAADEREAFLDDRCSADDDLRGRVDALLRAHDEPLDFLRGEEEGTESPGETAGSIIGRYKLLQQIGEGGFGTVWMAEQQEPVRRMVALKVIKLGMDTKQVVARFEAERQALALMDHPNIAKVLDGGATASGRPYFVMELVRGVPITEYCDEAKVSTRKRLELFLTVCNALQHAHQKGIIHRDLKPSNILVTLHDGVPVPKVIDFGIAKATHQRLTEKTLFTEYGMFIGTPDYMAPEQAEHSGLDVDTRADVYSLGVLLYELLTGARPFAGLRQRGYEEMLRVIREVDPPKPSTRISTLDEQVAVAERRGSAPKLLRRLVQGDLDWIVMKALEKDRSRRYDSASGMAGDVTRYLAQETVTARPPSRAYRLRKYAARNRAGVLAASIATLALVGGATAATVGFVRARGERDNALLARKTALVEAERAQDAEARALEEARNARAAEASEREQRELALSSERTARNEAEAAELINAFYDEMLVSIDPLQLRHRSGFAPENRIALGTASSFERDVSVTEMLRLAATEVESSFEGKPELEAKVRETIGVTLLGLGLHQEAAEQLKFSLDLFSRWGAQAEPDALRNRLLLGRARSGMGRHPEARRLVREALEGMTELHGAEDARTLHAASEYGEILTLLGEYDEAESLLKATLAEQRRVLTTEHRDTLDTLCKLTNVYLWQSNGLDGAEYAREAYEVSERILGEDDFVRVNAELNYGASCEFELNYRDARVILASALAKLERLVGEHCYQRYSAQMHLARSMPGDEHRAERKRLLREALEGLEDMKKGAPSTYVARRDLAMQLFADKEFDEGLRLARANYEVSSRVDGEGHARSVEALLFLRNGLSLAGRTQEAEEAYREFVRLRRTTAGEDAIATCSALGDLTNFLLAAGKVEEAGRSWQKILDLRRRLSEKLGGAGPHYEYGHLLLHSSVPGLEDPVRAIKPLITALELSEDRHLEAAQDLVLAYQQLDRLEEAAEMQSLLVDMSWENVRKLNPSGATLRFHTRLLLISEDPQHRDHEQAVEFARRAVAAQESNSDGLELLLRACLATGRLDEARSTVERLLEHGARSIEDPEAGLFELNSYLWQLVQMPFEELRPKATLIAVLDRLQSLTPGDWSMLNTLGIAQYRAGRFSEAVETLSRCDEMNRAAGVKEKRAWDLSFLAMSHQRLGNHDRAQELLTECLGLQDGIELDWFEQQELDSFLEEARALIIGEGQ